MTKSNTLFCDKNSQPTRNRRELPQPHQGHQQKPTATVMLVGDTECLSPKIRNKTRMSALPFLVNFVLEVPASAVRQEDDIKAFLTGNLSLFADGMILYRENPKESSKNLLELMI